MSYLFDYYMFIVDMLIKLFLWEKIVENEKYEMNNICRFLVVVMNVIGLYFYKLYKLLCYCLYNCRRLCKNLLFLSRFWFCWVFVFFFLGFLKIFKKIGLYFLKIIVEMWKFFLSNLIFFWKFFVVFDMFNYFFILLKNWMRL